mmetsp:Transcript_32462/g.70918  ORF Transcript_32462/g.70918 Transcript_32462/m.70918 type:complete len:214 (-) Transcript_32462:130-771(-)|eukprot:CAMPEP_0118924822 /NCGR_PEP_ID=MMETSP1169-20130426/2775_1 /TAXON_ID=36882 /ORGANISM="Pyramimonas obovata, Strain CCMP722" /LENGTH=213 /DNA_ID=CAMNT_0006865957 /DNA_START=146 /DNA_END=787 /DNA_ORIENTATION=+
MPLCLSARTAQHQSATVPTSGADGKIRDTKLRAPHARQATNMRLEIGRKGIASVIAAGSLAVAVGWSPAAWAGDRMIDLERVLDELKDESLEQLIQENIEFDRKTIFGKEDLQLFPEEIREERRKLVEKDEVVAYIEILQAATILRKELFIFGLIILFPSITYYLRVKKEADEYNKDVEEMYKPWSTGKRTEVKGKQNSDKVEKGKEKSEDDE